MDLIVRKRVVETSIINILYKLKEDLNAQNIYKLDTIKVSSNNALITCPIHGEGHERHPSCSVLLTNNSDNDDIPKGFVNCFACGYKAIFPQFISDCFNIKDKGEFGEEWILENCSCSFTDETRILPKLEINKNKQINNIKEKPKYVSEEELQSYRYYHPYMWKRKLTPEIVNKFDIGYDKKTNSLTFPVYDNNNNCLFVVKRNVATKIFQIPPNIEKSVFGLNQITSDINKVIICESVINALTCWVYGKPAVALFGTGTAYQINQLLSSHVRHFVLGFDGDSAGYKATVKFYKKLSKYKIVTEYHLPPGKDINDLSKEEFDNLIEY